MRDLQRSVQSLLNLIRANISCSISPFCQSIPIIYNVQPQAKVTLDHYISYLRHGLSTCYYCVSPMSFPEELQRKCIAHMRSPAPSGSGPESAPTPRAGDDEDEDRRDRDEGLTRSNNVEKERTGTAAGGGAGKSGDEKWEENLESKLKPLLGEVDVVEYGGRDIDE